MDVKKINTVNNDGKITEIEVDFDVWQFNEDDKWKTIYQKEKDKGRVFSYDEICERQENGEIAKIPKQLSNISTENEYIKIHTQSKQQQLIQNLFKAMNQLSEKQRRRIILRFFHNMTLVQIAEIEKTSFQVIDKSIKQGLKRLKKLSKSFFINRGEK